MRSDASPGVRGQPGTVRQPIHRIELRDRPLIRQHVGEADRTAGPNCPQRVPQRVHPDQLDRAIDPVGRDLADLGGDRAVIDQHVIGTELLELGTGLVTAGRRVHGEPLSFGQHNERETDGGRAATDQQRVAALGPHPHGQGPVRGLQHLRYGPQLLPRQVVRNGVT